MGGLKLVLLTGILLASNAGAQCPLQTLDNPAGMAGDFFGAAVAVDDGWAAISANWSDLVALDGGEVRVFEDLGGAWTKVQTLTGSAIHDYSIFGLSIDLVGDRLVVGADGEAYFFQRVAGVWIEQQRLVPIGSADPGPAYDVVLDGDHLLIGYPTDSKDANRAGAVYAYLWNGGSYSQVQRLTASDKAALKQFGGSIAVQGDRMLVGSSTYYGSHGSAYVFANSGPGPWVETAVLKGNGPHPDLTDAFGRSVALHGDTAFIGAPSEDTTLAGVSGAVYVFELRLGVWGNTAKFLGDPLVPEDGVGLEIELFGDVALVASGTGLTKPGRIHLVQRYANTWISTGFFQTPQPSGPGDSFGTSVDLDGDILFVGDTYAPTPGAATGAAHVLRMHDVPPAGATLTAAPSCLSVAGGGIQTLGIDGGNGLGGMSYWILGSLSGTNPGFSIQGLAVPLNIDAYLLFTVSQPGALPLFGGAASLDGAGTATALFVLVAASSPGLVGLRAHHAFAAYDPFSAAITHVSNPVSLDFQP
jgi:hypothetical protein